MVIRRSDALNRSLKRWKTGKVIFHIWLRLIFLLKKERCISVMKEAVWLPNTHNSPSVSRINWRGTSSIRGLSRQSKTDVASHVTLFCWTESPVHFSFVSESKLPTSNRPHFTVWAENSHFVVCPCYAIRALAGLHFLFWMVEKLCWTFYNSVPAMTSKYPFACFWHLWSPPHTEVSPLDTY